MLARGGVSVKKFCTFLIALCLAHTSLALADQVRDDNMTRIDICKQTYTELFGYQWQPNTGKDAEFMDILQKYIFGEVFTVGQLDMKTREMLTVTSLTAQQTLPQLKAHLNAALNAGVKPVELRETIYQCAPFIGFPKTLNAIGVFNEVIKERGLESELTTSATVTEENRHQKGAAIQQPLYGNEIAEAMRGLPNDMGSEVARFLTEFCFGDIYTRRGLDLKTRELMTIAVLVTNGQTSVLKSHIQGAIKAGNTKEEVTAAIIQCLPYVGFPNALASLKVLKELDLK